MRIHRRAVLAGLGAALAVSRARAAGTAVRLGLVQFGTVQWVADTIRAEGLDTAQQITLQTTLLANTDAARIALMAGSVDVTVVDWPFAALQRAHGSDLKFSAFSDTLGGLLVPAASPVRSLADLPGKRLGVAGGPADKSWLIVRAAAQKTGVDLSRADISYGAPPLLTGRLQQGALDAVLTYWTFAARLQAAGYRQAVAVEDCAKSLGLPGAPGLVGFAFHDAWAQAHPDAVPGLLRAVAAAEHVLRTSDAAWDRIRPLMNAPDNAVFDGLRTRFLAGLNHRPVAEAQKTADDLLRILIATGGPDALGGLQALPPGLFWPDVDGTG